MKRVFILLAISAAYCFAAPATWAIDRSGFEELSKVMDSARVLEVPVFSPDTWQKAEMAYAEADKSIRMEKGQKSVDKDVSRAREYTENAMKAAEVCKLSLQEYLEPRTKAIKAKAVTLVPKLYMAAEAQFMKATAKVESGNVKGALNEAEKAAPLFDTAELEAIRVDILGPADKLIQKAIADEAGKYALTTLDRANTAQEKANGIITADRYNRSEATQEAGRAEYEARHASNVALSVRSLNRNDQAWEKLMLVYEIQMDRVGEAAGLPYLPFDNGPLAAADTLIAYIQNLQNENARLTGQMNDLAGNLTGELRDILGRFNDSIPGADPIKLAEAVDQHVDSMIAENQILSEQAGASQAQLTELKEEHEVVAGQLAQRVETEEKFQKAKQMLNPSEGEVLFNSANDIVLRLSGLSFDVNKSEITDEHIPLLEKVKEVVQMFPESKIMVEGHTDASGEEARNVLLSEKRALAVMQYLRQSLLIPADRISSVGYGSDHPVASNETADGRAKNRRIDVIIMH